MSEIEALAIIVIEGNKRRHLGVIRRPKPEARERAEEVAAKLRAEGKIVEIEPYEGQLPKFGPPQRP